MSKKASRKNKKSKKLTRKQKELRDEIKRARGRLRYFEDKGWQFIGTNKIKAVEYGFENLLDLKDSKKIDRAINQLQKISVKNLKEGKVDLGKYMIYEVPVSTGRRTNTVSYAVTSSQYNKLYLANENRNEALRRLGREDEVKPLEIFFTDKAGFEKFLQHNKSITASLKFFDKQDRLAYDNLLKSLYGQIGLVASIVDEENSEHVANLVQLYEHIQNMSYSEVGKTLAPLIAHNHQLTTQLYGSGDRDSLSIQNLEKVLRAFGLSPLNDIKEDEVSKKDDKISEASESKTIKELMRRRKEYREQYREIERELKRQRIELRDKPEEYSKLEKEAQQKLRDINKINEVIQYRKALYASSGNSKGKKKRRKK